MPWNEGAKGSHRSVSLASFQSKRESWQKLGQQRRSNHSALSGIPEGGVVVKRLYFTIIGDEAKSHAQAACVSAKEQFPSLIPISGEEDKSGLTFTVRLDNGFHRSKSFAKRSIGASMGLLSSELNCTQMPASTGEKKTSDCGLMTEVEDEELTIIANTDPVPCIPNAVPGVPTVEEMRPSVAFTQAVTQPGDSHVKFKIVASEFNGGFDFLMPGEKAPNAETAAPAEKADTVPSVTNSSKRKLEQSNSSEEPHCSSKAGLMNRLHCSGISARASCMSAAGSAPLSAMRSLFSDIRLSSRTSSGGWGNGTISLKSMPIPKFGWVHSDAADRSSKKKQSKVSFGPTLSKRSNLSGITIRHDRAVKVKCHPIMDFGDVLPMLATERFHSSVFIFLVDSRLEDSTHLCDLERRRVEVEFQLRDFIRKAAEEREVHAKGIPPLTCLALCHTSQEQAQLTRQGSNQSYITDKLPGGPYGDFVHKLQCLAKGEAVGIQCVAAQEKDANVHYHCDFDDSNGFFHCLTTIASDVIRRRAEADQDVEFYVRSSDVSDFSKNRRCCRSCSVM